MDEVAPLVVSDQIEADSRGAQRRVGRCEADDGLGELAERRLAVSALQRR